MADLSKNNGAPVLMRARSTVAFSVKGTNVILQSGALYPADDPIVRAASWAFERDVDAGERPELQALVRNLTGNGSPAVDPKLQAAEQTAASRLRKVRDEITALAKPLQRGNGSGPADVATMTAKLVDRDARRQALELLLPSVEREAATARLRTAKAAEAIAQASYDAAGETFRTIEQAYFHAEADRETVRALVAQAFQKLQSVQRQADAEADVIAQLDTAAGLVHEPNGEGASSNGPLPTDDAIVVDLRRAPPGDDRILVDLRDGIVVDRPI